MPLIIILLLKEINYYLLFFIIPVLAPSILPAQMITGTWHGKINRQKTEVKIIQKGDSLTGTSYYYESPGNYRRYSIKGYFDLRTNEAVWWDDQLLEEKSGRFSIGTSGKIPLLSRADFNCPGSGKMMLDGKSVKKEDPDGNDTNLHLDKSGNTVFEDEWDFIIKNYTAGANDPDFIDSVAQVAFQPRSVDMQPPPPVNTIPVMERPEKNESSIVTKPARETKSVPVENTFPVTLSIEEKFKTREKVYLKEIPVSGDSVELRFYDNAEIDGDSISLFLNDKLIHQHIRLSSRAYTIKLAVNELQSSNELTMVAENLGSIPPNTAYMVAIVNEQRYTAYLASTEGSSAMIRFIKKK